MIKFATRKPRRVTEVAQTRATSPVSLDGIRVIAPNFKSRLSGVTATIVRLVPLQAQTIGIVATGPGLPEHVPCIPLLKTLCLRRNQAASPVWRVWHARRNTEMLAGLILKWAFRRRLKLVFTSASQRVHTRWSRFLISRMDAVIATSAATQSYLNVPSTVIMHGIDTTLFCPASDKAEVRRSLNLPEASLIGCFGRIRPQKGTDVFVDAMLETLPDFPGVAAVVLGRATGHHRDYLEGLKAKVREAGLVDRVLFPPEVPVHKIAQWYQALDLFVAPQRWEGFGLTPLEAMACGVPVVATTVGAFPELVVDGETGQMVPPGEAGPMADAIRAFLTNRTRLASFSGNARSHAEKRFRIEDEAIAINRVYTGLLNEGTVR